MLNRIATVAAVATLSGCSVASPHGSASVGRATGTEVAVASAPDPRTDAVRVRAQSLRNEQAAERQAALVLASMPRPAGSQPVPGSRVPPLTRSSTSLSGPDISVTRSGFWLIPGADAHALADWYTLHAPPAMHSDAHAIGGSRNTDGSWSENVFYDGLAGGSARDSAAILELTPVGRKVGVRITVYTSWRPARPSASFTPTDVSAVRIEVVRDTHKRLVTVRDSAAIARLRRAYDSLPGTGGLSRGCPFPMHPTDFRITSISSTRQIVATMSESCVPRWTVTANGAPLAPALRDVGQFRPLLLSSVAMP